MSIYICLIADIILCQKSFFFFFLTTRLKYKSSCTQIVLYLRNLFFYPNHLTVELSYIRTAL